MTIEEVFKKILDSCFQVHTALGAGLLESAYEECLYYELIQNGLKVEKQKALPLGYKDIRLEARYRIDLIVENSIMIEIKSVDLLSDVHLAQILTYLKLSNSKLGLLVNYKVRHLKDGIKRVIL